MADTDREDRTLPPSPRRLEKAREEGQVPRSRELAGALLFGAAFAALAVSGPSLLAGARELMRAGLTFDHALAMAPQRALDRWSALVLEAAQSIAPLLVLLGVAAALASLALGGWQFTWKPVMPSWSRIDPLAGLARLVSLRAWLELGKSLLKALLLLGATAWVLGETAAGLARLALADPAGSLASGAGIAMQGALALAVAMAVIAALDVPLVLFTHRRDLRMTRREAQDEQRETEGDPQLKARVRGTQRAMARRRMMSAVPRASVVVTNPTRFAVAIEWREGMAAPRVVAKGTGEVAARIRAIAAGAGVPLVEAPALARALHRHVELEREVPAALYQAVAQVLAWVFQVRRAAERGEREPPPPRDVAVPAGLDPQEAPA